MIFVAGRHEICPTPPILKSKARRLHAQTSPRAFLHLPTPQGERESPWAAGDHPKHLSKPVDAQASPTLDGKGSHGVFLSNCKHEDQQKGRGMLSEPALWLFWSNYLISLIDPNIYAFSCCSTNIVRTCDFITSQTETLQDAPDESPKDSASSFSLFLSSNSFSVCSIFR